MNDRIPQARTIEPDRKQGIIRFEMPEISLPSTHPARILDRILGDLDLTPFTAHSTAVEGHAGRSSLSPRMKLTLWLYAVSRGIGSAREIARRTRTEDAFRWIVGDLEVSHHALSAFRVGHGAALDRLMTDVLATLLHKGLLTLDQVAQDGTRIRASASAPSFRRHASLLECRDQAALHLKAVLAQIDEEEMTTAQRAARQAAAQDFQRRVEEAIATVVELQNERDQRKPSRRPKTAPRASTTDAEARVMKMGDGGFRPGYNVRVAVAGSPEGGPRTIVGVDVTNVGSDLGSVAPMLDQIERRTGRLPKRLLADANHAKHACIETLVQRGVDPLISVPDNMHADSRRTTPEVRAWHTRMEEDEARRLYRARSGLVELVNAHMKRMGLDKVLVRGLPKVTCVALLTAISSNLLQNARGLLG